MTIISLARTYSENLTQGELMVNGKRICRTIELPWMRNIPNESCIPEGYYHLSFRQSERFGLHMQVHGVPKRKYILIHPANHAKKELRGCIAPVLDIKNERGLYSRAACQILLRAIRKLGIHNCQLHIFSQ